MGVPTKYTESMLLDAVERKYNTGALIRQVTLSDAEAFAEWEFAVENPGTPWARNPFTRRIDGLLMISMQRTAIEVKVSRGDYRNESDEKRRAWRKYAHRFVYLTPAGLITPSAIPDGCGLWEFDGLKVKTVRNATVAKDVPDFPADFTRTVLWRLAMAEAKLRRGA